MNGYLQSKCRSEQQLMNELTRLVAAKDLTGKKMSELLRELSFFYVSPSFGTVPHALLKDFCTCLVLLKDKKDDLRIVRILFCYISRLVDAFEMHHRLLLQQQQQQPTDPRSQSFEQFTVMMTNVFKVIETNELAHASLPRQCTSLKLYLHLGRLFGKSSTFFTSKIKPLIEKSPVWTSLSDMKKIKKEFPAQVAALSTAFHGVRFHMTPKDQQTLAQTLFQACFLSSQMATLCPSASCNASIASRHAAGTLLKLLMDDLNAMTTSSASNSSGAAQEIVEAFEWYFGTFTPATLLVGDVLASIYLIRLVGTISRLPVRDDKAVTASPTAAAAPSPPAISAASNLLDLSFDPRPLRTTSIHQQQPSRSSSPGASSSKRNVQTGPPVSAALSMRAKELVLDVLCTPDTFVVPRAIVFVAIEEATKDQHAMECFEKAGRGHGLRQGMCVYEIVAQALTKQIKQFDHAIGNVSTGTSAALVANAGSTVLLHRICRSTQFVGETLDIAIVEMMEQDAANPRTRSSNPSVGNSFGDPAGQLIDPSFLDKLADKMMEFTSHVNEFTACESLLALVWLLPRQGSTKNASEKWKKFLELLQSSNCAVHPTRRQSIIETLLRRATGISPQFLDVQMLKRTLEICLGWFFEAPCEWHEDALVKIWQIAVDKCFDKLGAVVVESIHKVLQFFRPHAIGATVNAMSGGSAAAGFSSATIGSSFVSPQTLAAIQQVHHGTLHLLLQGSMQKCLLALVNNPDRTNGSSVLATMLILQLLQMALCEDFATRRLAIQIVFGFGQLAFQSGNVAIHQMISSMLSNLRLDPAKKQFTREGLLLEDLLADFCTMESSSSSSSTPPVPSMAARLSTGGSNAFIGTMYA